MTSISEPLQGDVASRDLSQCAGLLLERASLILELRFLVRQLALTACERRDVAFRPLESGSRGAEVVRKTVRLPRPHVQLGRALTDQYPQAIDLLVEPRSSVASTRPPIPRSRAPHMRTSRPRPAIVPREMPRRQVANRGAVAASASQPPRRPVRRFRASSPRRREASCAPVRPASAGLAAQRPALAQTTEWALLLP